MCGGVISPSMRCFITLVNGELLDFVGGLEDLRHGKIRLIGDPEQRFREDPVRLLRAIRFAAKLGFEIEAHTQAPMEGLAILLEAVSSARLFDEIIKLLHSGDGLETFRLLREYGVLQHLLPLTAESIAEDTSGNFGRMVELSLGNTDQRIREGKSVMPAFLYAVLLWYKVHLAALDLGSGRDAGNTGIASGSHRCAAGSGRFYCCSTSFQQYYPRNLGVAVAFPLSGFAPCQRFCWGIHVFGRLTISCACVPKRVSRWKKMRNGGQPSSTPHQRSAKPCVKVLRSKGSLRRRKKRKKSGTSAKTAPPPNA